MLCLFVLIEVLWSGTILCATQLTGCMSNFGRTHKITAMAPMHHMGGGGVTWPAHPLKFERTLIMWNESISIHIIDLSVGRISISGVQVMARSQRNFANTKYALSLLCMTWDSDPTLMTRAPREGQGPSEYYTLSAHYPYTS